MNKESRQIMTSLPSASTLFLIYGFSLAILLLALLGSWLIDRPISDFTRDLAAIAHIPPYIGFVSNVGILLWCAATTIALMSAALMSRTQAHALPARFFISLGALSSILMLDDFFEFHEWIFPKFLGIHEKTSFLLYGILLLYILIRFRSVYLKTSYFLLYSALCGLAMSVLIDRVPDNIIPHHYLFEDGFKLIGIANWLAFTLQAAFDYIPLITNTPESKIHSCVESTAGSDAIKLAS